MTALQIHLIFTIVSIYCIFLKVTAGVPLPKEYITEVSNVYFPILLQIIIFVRLILGRTRCFELFFFSLTQLMYYRTPTISGDIAPQRQDENKEGWSK